MCGIFAYKGTNIPKEKLVGAASRIRYRGPDVSTYQSKDDIFFAFHRLSIIDLSHRGDQPFVNYERNSFLICNGEIYNAHGLRRRYASYDYKSTSDCEVLLPAISALGIEELSKILDAEFALVYYNFETKSLEAARDPIGIRPLFYGKNPDGEIAFASEAKALVDLFEVVEPFPPGHFYKNGEFVQYRSMVDQVPSQGYKGKPLLSHIAQKLTTAVMKRLQSDAPIGFLLSGGLDSSLVCAIASQILKTPIRTFSVGSNKDAIDLPYAEQVAAYIGARHESITFTQEEVMECLDHLIYVLETWDVTTIRASIGMYLVCKWIRENTDIKVIMTGEVSDELFGYKYTDFAPNGEEFQKEAQKRIREIHMYDVLRADRCISCNGLEARVPFGDLDFVDLVMTTPGDVKMNTHGKGKFLLRQAFEFHDLLPKRILQREKAAFSDAVGHSVADGIREVAENNISDGKFERFVKKYDYCPPLTKEGMFYRQIFEKHFPGRAKLIPGLWLPNQEWKNCNVTDPSARALPNYGKSGE